LYKRRRTLRLKGPRAVLFGAAALLAAGAFAWPLQAAVAVTTPKIGAECYNPAAHCITLAAVSLEGLTAYKPGELAPLYDAYLTHDVGIADLTAIATAITDRYRKDGYFLSRAVVPQQLRGGHMARIQIYEGYIDEVTVTGPGSAFAARTLKSVSGKKPLKLAQLDRALALAGDAPGISVRSHLEPDIDDPARHHLVAATTTDRVEGSAYVDNRGPHAAGPWQAYLRAAINSALWAGDQLSLAVLTVPFDMKAFSFGELAYALPLGGGGDRLRAAFSLAKAHDGADPISQDVGSDSWAANISYLKPLWRSRRVNSFAQLTASARDVEQDWTSGGQYRDQVRALRGMISATFVDPGSSTNLWAQVSAGRRGDNGAMLSRADASKDFTKLNAHAAHYRDLGSHAGLYVAADGQYTNDRLLASEEFIVGGAPYGRGYSYAAIGGDRGVAGTAELRAGFKPNIKGISFIQGYTFLDASKVWNRGAGSYDLASTGAGVRVRLGDKATLGLEAAKPLRKVPYEKDMGWKPYVYLSAVF
jgi:hemolysin activation/secretion protein